MKKSKIITGLSAGFMAAIALSSCSLIKSKSGVVLTINGVDYKAEDLFKDQKSASVGEAKFNAVYKVAVRQYFKSDAQKDVLAQIQKDARNKVSGQKDLASSNASKNGTSYDTEWNKILSSNKVDDEQGLYDKFEYDLEKEKFDDQFYEKNLDKLRDGGDLYKKGTDTVTVDGYLKKKQPYHVKHILVKVSAAADDPTRGEIKEEEAKKLHDVIVALAKGKNFGDVAKWYSDDTGSKDKFGDLGIMDRDTSFVNEFKLGTYLYESYFGKSTTTPDSKYTSKIARNELFGLDQETTSTEASDIADSTAQLIDPTNNSKATVTNRAIGQIPFEAALALGYDDYTLQDDKRANKGYGKVKFSDKLSSVLPATDDKAAYYPRNVIFNKFFNRNNIMVITPRRMHFSNTWSITEVGDDKPVKTLNALVKKEIKQVTNKTKEETSAAVTPDKIRQPESAVVTNPSETESEVLKSNTYHGEETTAFNITDDDGKYVYSGFHTPTDKIKNGDVLSNSINGDDNNDPILRNTDGRTIFVFRSGTTGDSSYQGIHFVCIERSPFIDNEYETRTVGGTQVETKEPVTISKYYTYNYPGEASGNYPKYPSTAEEGFKNTNMPTYVNAINTPDPSSLKTRADDVKTKIKNHDSILNTYVYQYLIKNGDIKFASTDEAGQIEKDIKQWIDLKREDTKYASETTWKDTWETYHNKIEESIKVREQKPVKIGESGSEETIYRGGIISEVCALAYANADLLDTQDIKDLFGVGGAFHD